MRTPGQNLYDGGKLSRLLAQMPDPNNGTHTGGLGSVLMKAIQGYQMGKEMQADEDAQAVMKKAGEAMMGTPAVPDAPGPTMEGDAGYTIAGKAGDRNLAASLLMGNDRTAPYGIQMVQDNQRLAFEQQKMKDEQAWREKNAPLVKVVNPSDGKGMYVRQWDAEGAVPFSDSMPHTITTAEGVYERDPQDPSGLGRRLGGAPAMMTMPQWVPQQTPNGSVLVNPKTGDMKPDPSAPPQPSANDRSKLKEAEVNAQSIKSALWDYRDADKSAGTWDRVKSVAGLGTDLNTKYNNAALMAKGEAMYNLGVLSGPDLDILRRTLTDPSTIKSLGADQGTVAAQVAAMEKLLDTRLAAYRAQYGGGQQTPLPPASGGGNIPAPPPGFVPVGGR